MRSCKQKRLERYKSVRLRFTSGVHRGMFFVAREGTVCSCGAIRLHRWDVTRKPARHGAGKLDGYVFERGWFVCGCDVRKRAVRAIRLGLTASRPEKRRLHADNDDSFVQNGIYVENACHRL